MAERGIDVPSLSPPGLSDLVSYLYFFQFIDRPGDPARGRIVFRTSSAETATRSAAGKTSGLLAEGEAPSTPLAIITGMWNHAGKMDVKMLEENLSWPTLKGAEVADLIAYILSARERTGASGAAQR
jgi:hypothetical protein